MATSTIETALAAGRSSLCTSPKIHDEATSVLKGRLPEMRTIEPNSPTARAKASPAPASTDGSTLGRIDAAEHLAPGGAERGGGVLDFGIELGQHRLDAAHAEGQGHEEQRGADAEAGAGQVDVEGAVDPVQREQRQAGHDGRQREGQVDEGAQQSLAAEVVAHEHEGDGQARDRVDHRHDGGDGQRELQRRDRLRLLTAAQNSDQPPLNALVMTAATGNSTSSDR